MAKRIPSWEVSDAFWERVVPLIPAQARSKEKHYQRKAGGGRKPLPPRRVFEGIVYVLRTGCQWKALPAARFGSASSIHKRFLEWAKAGVFLRLWQAGRAEHDEVEGIAWRWQSIDGTMVKAPLAQESVGPNPTDRGKNGSKRMLLVDERGVPLSIIVTGANRHDVTQLAITLDSIVVERPEVTPYHPQNLCADAGFTGTPAHEQIVERDYRPHVRSRGEEKVRKWDGILLGELGLTYGTILTSGQLQTIVKSKAPLTFCRKRCRFRTAPSISSGAAGCCTTSRTRPRAARSASGRWSRRPACRDSAGRARCGAASGCRQRRCGCARR